MARRPSTRTDRAQGWIRAAIVALTIAAALAAGVWIGGR